MRSRYPLGDFAPGRSWLHRTPLWVKAMLVAAVGISTFWIQLWWVSLAAVGAAVVLFLSAGLTLRRLGRLLWGPAPVLVVLFIFQWWQLGPDRAAVIVGNIVLCLVVAALLTLTTPVQTLLDGLTSLLGPARRSGADPERFALTVAMALRSIPYLVGLFSSVRDSARARGLQGSIRARTTPVVLQAVAYGRRTGDALAARGLGDAEEP